jgi:hypothetical protein
MTRWLYSVGLGLVAALGFAGPASAADEIPFQASGHRVHVSIEKVPGGDHILNVIPDGESNLGDWVGDIDLFVRGAQVAGTMVITFDPGNTISVAFEQKWSPDVGEFGGTIGEFVVTGGTGRFRGAGGGGTIAAVYLDKKFVEVLVELDGAIIVP